MHRIIFGLLALVLIGLPLPAMAQPNGGVCTTPATVSFPDFPARRADIVPSIHRQLSGIGRLAKGNGCDVVVTCVAPTGANEDAKKARDRQCSAAAQAIVRYETRAAVRTELTKAITQKKVAAGSGLTVGTVYVTLK